MPTQYWGATEKLGPTLPQTVSGWLLLVCYLAITIALLYRFRGRFQQFGRRQWFMLLAFAGLAFATSELLPLVFSRPSLATPVVGRESAVFSVALLAAVPPLLAGSILGPAPALLVGLTTGLGHAVGQPSQLVAMFHYGYAAWIAAVLLCQAYDGRIYGALRMPLVAAVLGGFTVLLLTALSAFVAAPPGLLIRLDVALGAAEALFWSVMLTSLVGGLIVTLLYRAFSELRPSVIPVLSASKRSVHSYLVRNTLLFGLTAALIVILFVLAVSISWVTRLNVIEMAAAANASAIEVAALHSELETSLAALGRDDRDASGAVSARTMGQYFRSRGDFTEIILVDAAANILEVVPAGTVERSISTSEREGVHRVMSGRIAAGIAAPGDDLGEGLSLIVLATGGATTTPAALIGRIDPAALAKTFTLPATNASNASIAVLGQSDQVFVKSGQGDAAALWLTDALAAAQPLLGQDVYGGTAFLLSQGNAGRQLVYFGPDVGRNWRVALAVPFAAVFGQALTIALPLAILMLGLTAVFYARTASYSRALTSPLSELAQASRVIAAGGSLPPRPRLDRPDEIGELDRAFADMHGALRRRLDDLSLLLAVSQEAATSIDLQETMPAVLQGAIRGTGASGARALVLNPSSGFPLVFMAGPAAEEMALFDRPLMGLVRDQGEVMLSSPAEIAAAPAFVGLDSPPVKALRALRLQANGKFQGFLLLGYRQEQPALSGSEMALLQTLAGQASMLVEKSYLYASAEGGRRRLAAILASTSEAVIVTDQTARILIINRSFEKAFGLSAAQAIGRSVRDVLPSERLVDALTQAKTRRENMELIGRDRQTYFANSSPIVSTDGQVLGRVAVLHDVTHLKELDRIKSEFVDNVSHDLRTPLTVLNGYAAALAALDDLTPEQRSYSDHISRSVERMTQLVEDLLDLGRLEAGVELVLEEVDIRELLHGLANEYRALADDSGVGIRVHVADDVDIVRGDRVLLNQALSNLLVNACKYAPDSGDLALFAARSGGELVLGVQDRGPGIAGQDQMRLFEKFYRVKRHGAGKAKGSGLGLAIVKRIAERHEGRAWCESDLGQGSTFFIALPLAPQE